jgi:hypothetical protein
MHYFRVMLPVQTTGSRNPKCPETVKFPPETHMSNVHVNAHTQGHCTKPFSAPAGPAMMPLKANQCVLTTKANTFQLGNSQIWLDNLYFRRAAAGDGDIVMVYGYLGLEVPYLTKMSFQGDGKRVTTGISAIHGKGYLEGALPLQSLDY